jgi:hypothetical protein
VPKIVKLSKEESLLLFERIVDSIRKQKKGFFVLKKLPSKPSLKVGITAVVSVGVIGLIGARKMEEPKEVTSNDLKRQDNIDKLFERQEKRLAEVKQDFKDEIFTKEEYLERIKSIEEQTNIALSKFGEGGKV